jgi:hypothetical protein
MCTIAFQSNISARVLKILLTIVISMVSMSNPTIT